METVKISPKFQVVIPRSILESLGLQPGQKVQAVLDENRIEFIPVRPLEKARRSRRDRYNCAAVQGPGMNVVDSSAWLEYFADGPNADSFAAAIVVLATARHYGAVLWTQDADFEGLDRVNYVPKGRRSKR